MAEFADYLTAASRRGTQSNAVVDQAHPLAKLLQVSGLLGQRAARRIQERVGIHGASAVHAEVEVGRGGACVAGIADESQRVSDLDLVTVAHVLTVEVCVVDVGAAHGVPHPYDLAAQVGESDSIDAAG